MDSAKMDTRLALKLRDIGDILGAPEEMQRTFMHELLHLLTPWLEHHHMTPPSHITLTTSIPPPADEETPLMPLAPQRQRGMDKDAFFIFQNSRTVCIALLYREDPGLLFNMCIELHIPQITDNATESMKILTEKRQLLPNQQPITHLVF